MLAVEHNDPINASILAISEDKIEGFVREPFEEIARRSGVGVDVVMARIAAMLRAALPSAGATDVGLFLLLCVASVLAWLPLSFLTVILFWLITRAKFQIT